MNHSTPVFLTIAIPTYNGASSYLKVVLDFLIPILQDGNEVEIVVSDNCSSDDTPNLLSGYAKFQGFRYFRQKSNIGFKNNMLFLINNLVQSEYCWFLGDDDILFPNVVRQVVSFLRKSKVDFVKIGYERIEAEKIRFLQEPQNNSLFQVGSYARAIDYGSFDGNAFATFMSSSIFRVGPFVKNSKFFADDGKDAYYNTFPNAYLLAKSFSSLQCGYTGERLVFPIIRNKDWAKPDRLYKITSVYLPEFYDFLISIGLKRNELKNTRKRILFLNIESGVIRLKERKKVAGLFWESLLKSFAYPSVYIKFFKEVLCHFIKR